MERFTFKIHLPHSLYAVRLALLFLLLQKSSASIYSQKLARFFKKSAKENFIRNRKSLCGREKNFFIFLKRAGFFLRIFDPIKTKLSHKGTKALRKKLNNTL
ncbi:MAG: hypothetical protein JW806_06950 [Sedimentisphaerales bacterium]|nr:hypothetical protein [Sedimentisphaerales bacterium]